MAKSYRDLNVWQKAHQLTLRVYEVTRTFPKEELVGLTSQMRRTCTVIPANIVEGQVGGGDVDFSRLLDAAQAAASSLEYYLLLAHDLHYIDAKTYDELAQLTQEVKRTIASFRTGLRAYR